MKKELMTLNNELKVIDTLLKDKEYVIKIFWEKNPYVMTSNYTIAFLEKHKNEKPNVVDRIKIDFIESLVRFAKNGPTTHVSQVVPDMMKTSMFENKPKIKSFHDTFHKFAINKEITIFSEDGKSLTLGVVETCDKRTFQKTSKLLTEIKAEGLQEILLKLEQYMKKCLEIEKLESKKRPFEFFSTEI